MKFHLTLLLALFFITTSTYAQDSILIGQWQDYLNYRQSTWVTQSTEEVILSTGRALIFIDKKDNSYYTTSKVEGLNETQIKLIKFDKFNSQLFVIYNSGAFDILNEEGITYVSSIKSNPNIFGSKSINDIHIANENQAFMATSFGVIEYHLKKREFSSTIFTNAVVHAVSSDDQFVYAAVDGGIYYTEVNNSNKENFSKWNLFSVNSGLPATYSCKNLEVFNHDLYVVIDDQLYRKGADNKFIKVDLNRTSDFKIEWLSAEASHLLIGLKNSGFESEIRAIDSNKNLSLGGAGCMNRTIYGIEDENGRVWYADEWRQIRYTNSLNDRCNRVEYDSPFSFEGSHIETDNGKVYIASGGATENFQFEYNHNGVYILNEDHTWTNVNTESYPEISQKDFFNLQTIAPHPTNKDLLYIGSYFKGFLIFNQKSKKIEFFGENPPNTTVNPSSLQSIIGAPGQVRIPFIKFDKVGNLWLSNFGAPKPISVFTKDGVWKAFSSSGDNLLVNRFTIDQSENKWFVSGPSNSIVVFNENGTIDDTSDDRYHVINRSNSLIEGSINCAETDLDGTVWVGTSAGPIIFDCDPFQTNPICGGSQIKVVQDNIPALLLQTEDILCIEFDGANRKWFGTRNGIFVQSADGDIQEFRFNEENSPLLSNTVYDLEFEGASGIMYIITSQGIQSVKTNSLGANNRHESLVYVYPNPVKPEYNGPIAIKGLARDADVKITDLNGRLVFQNKAYGGQAIWDGNDYNGRRADTGVYLVFSASEKNPEVKDTFVTKILIVK